MPGGCRRGHSVVGTFLRLFKLALVPLHHDEGVNGNFLMSLVRDGQVYSTIRRTITAPHFTIFPPLSPGSFASSAEKLPATNTV